MRRLFESAACGALFLILPATAATIVTQSGDIVTYLSNLSIPGAGTNAFVTPDLDAVSVTTEGSV